MSHHHCSMTQGNVFDHNDDRKLPELKIIFTFTNNDRSIHHHCDDLIDRSSFFYSIRRKKFAISSPNDEFYDDCVETATNPKTGQIKIFFKQTMITHNKDQNYPVEKEIE
ncbi:hypothetical protein DERF_009914 [Dermatophagoides farinae]|uniref:Uncharacterized protein n=1 Tax=Dermatophagoides farinae TaxID=6954 RepID=A0A922HYY4_DERFA|nr:hypothetical protein DERF_009914 [Dermatophagoides farinae]